MGKPTVGSEAFYSPRFLTFRPPRPVKETARTFCRIFCRIFNSKFNSIRTLTSRGFKPRAKSPKTLNPSQCSSSSSNSSSRSHSRSRSRSRSRINSNGWVWG